VKIGLAAHQGKRLLIFIRIFYSNFAVDAILDCDSMTVQHSEGAVAFRPLNLGRKLGPPSGAGTGLAVNTRPGAKAPSLFASASQWPEGRCSLRKNKQEQATDAPISSTYCQKFWMHLPWAPHPFRALCEKDGAPN
jgi:hypothetical protein